MTKKTRPVAVFVEDDKVAIEWDVKLGRIAGGYPTGADYNKNRIRMSAGQRRSVSRENLMHELLHKLWDKSLLSRDYSEKTEEYIITSLTGWLVDVLRDNPELVDFLTEDS